MSAPSLSDFLRVAEPGVLVPVYREIHADRLTPVSALERLREGRRDAPCFLLESVEGGENLARYSFLGVGDMPQLVVDESGWRLLGPHPETGTRAEGEDALTPLKRAMERHRFVEVPGLPKFCGGAVGFIGWDAVRGFEHLPSTTPDLLHVPHLCFLLADDLLVFDHVRHRIMVVSAARVGEQPAQDYDAAVRRIDETISRLRAPWSPPAPTAAVPPPSYTANLTQEEYEAVVRRCQQYILAGDAFQIVPSIRFSCDLPVDPWEVYRALRSVNPSPYMYFLQTEAGTVVGSSPEILVTVHDRRARVRPIAGTRPRGSGPAEDDRLAEELLADEKERAEHIMLVDLGRNDVGRVSEYGTVQVDELMLVERYSHVMHIVSNVTGILNPEKDVFDVTRACFPAGTLSGAPKVRAMEIIEELEPSRRGLYGGAVGYYSYGGEMDLAIAIRTMWVAGGKAHIQAGAGVVADSVPATEYHECVNKSRALRAAVEMACAGLDN
jgi:anthranilate synthase component 1